jgi:hypothetical protein
MLNLFKRSAPRNPSIREALVRAGLSAAGDPARVAVVEKHGDYVGRRVNFFTAFEPRHREVLLASGHVEQKGVVVINYQPQPEGASPTRVPANRSAHADDDKLVFWDEQAAMASEAALSATVMNWQRGRSRSIAGV